ncbi:selenium metabolism protein YedF [Desulfotomaculum arcticum]|uniref:Selenium metabolism protein YedF n=1 Tax=Desulfotruncus arcticus DSM 17038 TaxID=1121424 RepID=A0A1I2XGT0_9FIRM|nr:sulfurtransferase-like selenium metabolism protein YedF [Desulfotruncus arcticus]SFH12622.1 selenium metabolism protein YedF [Desulfotomaculum arcticum] [Desulfotruncus arcticus DSM 17038]
MQHKIVDCRGLACPQPVINTKNALEETDINSVTTIVDNDVARQNITLFAKNSGYTVISNEKKDGFYHLTVSKSDKPSSEPGTIIGPKSENDTGVGPVYFITTNSLGQGSPDLGQVLIKSLFTTLVATKPLPSALLFLNTGVFLTCEGSPVLEQIEKMRGEGTAVLSCGTCLDYYKLKDKLSIGNISNMFDINNQLIGPGKVIAIG